MSMSEFERLLEVIIPASGSTALTLTQTPMNPGDLVRWLEQAIVAGNRRAAPLSEIHMPMSAYPDFGTHFWHLPIEDSGSDGVVRLVFTAQETLAAKDSRAA